jgi:biotin operon repressor
MATLLDTLAVLANDGRWYSKTALGAKLHIGASSVTAAVSRLRKVPGYSVEKRRLNEHGNQWEYRITASVPSPLPDAGSQFGRQ